MNKNKTIWDILKLGTNKTGNSVKAISLNTDGTSVSNHQELANQFSRYFISKAKRINNHNDSKSEKLCNTTPIQYLLQSLRLPSQILI
jgi:hypothetical protein